MNPSEASPDRISRSCFVRSAAAASLGIYMGCDPAQQPSGSAPKPSAAPPAKKLRLLVIDDPDFGKTIAREWRARTEQEIDVQAAAVADIAKAQRLPGDAIICSSGILAHLAERGLIVPLDAEQLRDEGFARQDIFEHVRLREMNWGNKPFAVPLGSPQFVLLYRRDVFEHLQIQPPQTWAQYQELLERLSNRDEVGDLAPPAESSWSATAEPLASGWAGLLLLARAAAYALHKDQVSPLLNFDSLEPLLAAPPYVRALTELVAAATTDRSRRALTAADAYAQFLAGRSAMAITWPQNAESKAKNAASKQVAFGCSELPGAREMYNFATKAWDEREAGEDQHVSLLGIAGRLGAVTASAPQPRSAQGFLQWLAGAEMSGRISPRSQATTLFRESHIPQVGRWLGSDIAPAAATNYGEVLKAAQSRPRWMWSLRLPGRDEYLAALDEAVIAAVKGDQQPADALAAAAKKWNAITERLGLVQQRQAHQRSLGQATFH